MMIMNCDRGGAALVLWLLLELIKNAGSLSHGRHAKEGEFPFIARILVSDRSPHSCHVKTIEKSIREHPEILRKALKEFGRSRSDRSGMGLDREIDPSAGYVRESNDTEPINSTKNEESIYPPSDKECSKAEPDVIRDYIKALLEEFASNKASKIAAGVLISNTRILTTCGTVKLFSGSHSDDIPLYKTLIKIGSTSSSAGSGEFRVPIAKKVHPHCKFLISTKTIVFDYAIYVLPTQEISSGLKVAPVTRSYESGEQMGLALHSIMAGNTEVKCHSLGWGNDDKRFEGKGMPDNFHRFTQNLQTTRMTIVGFPECYEGTCKYFKECLKPLMEYGFFCAKASSGGPCTEDWATPLVCEGEIFGIHVEPRKCMDTGVPRLFLRTDLAFDFVFDVKSESIIRTFDGPTVFAGLFLCFHLHGWL